MIKFVTGDIFASDCHALVNPVNTVGVMGRGLAKEFKDRFPSNYKLYKEACHSGDLDCEGLRTGTLFWSRDMLKGRVFSTPVIIINFPTKAHYRDSSHISYIKEGLNSLHELITNQNIKSVAIPPLGCGLGGLNWSDVKPLIIEKLVNLSNVNIVVYEPM